MDSRLIVGLVTLALPAVLLGVTIWEFSSNPLALVALMGVMVLGAAYILSYKDSF
jgi:hypothetical protein